MKRCLLMLMTLSWTLPVSANWLEQAELVTQLGYGYGSYVDARNAATLELTPDLTFNLEDALQARVSGRLRGDERDFLMPGQPRLTSYSSASRPHAIDDDWLLELRDAYLEVSMDAGTIRLGKQQLVWGALDGIKVLDVLNPQSYEKFILEDFDQSRIGLWSAYADLSLGDWRFEVALIPDTTTHYVPEQGAWFELMAPRFRFGQTDPSNTLPVQYGEPEDKRGTAGVRLSRYIGGFDLQLIATSGLEFEPLGRLVVSDGQPAVETYHERRNLFGVGLESSFAAFALRAELTYSPNRVFNTRLGNVLADETREHWRGGLGLDWDAPFGLFLNLQYLHDHIAAAPQGLLRDADDRIVTAFLKRQFLYDTLDVEARWYASVEDKDRLFRLMVEYQLSDHTSLQLALDDFKGDERGVFGQFDQRDQVTFSLKHTF